MGFFDKLLNGLKSEITSEIKSEIKNQLNSAFSSKSETEVSEPVKNTTPVENIYDQNYNTGDDYFAALITEANFPGYTIEKSVHPNVFDASAHPKCYPISYLFKKDGVPALAVFVMNTNQYRAMIAVGTYNVLDDNNIKYIRFFKGMKNEESYVLNRIRDNLK